MSPRHIATFSVLAGVAGLLIWTTVPGGGGPAYERAPGTRSAAPAAHARADGRASTTDWPRYRGPAGDGISVEAGFRKSFPAEGLPVLWRVPLGSGFSGMSVVGERLFTMYGRDRIEWIASFDVTTGDEVWRFRSDGVFVDAQGHGPRSTPTVHDGLVYALGAKGKLNALDVADGRLIWGRDLVADLGGRPPRWGVATVPIVVDDLLLVNAGGRSGSSVVAFDRHTGSVVWRSQDDLAGYAAPIVVTLDGVRQAVFFTGNAVISLAPRTGELYWRVPWRTSFDVNAASPVFVPPDRIFVSSGYDTGAALLRMIVAGGAVEVEKIWNDRVMKNQFSSSVYHDGFIYGFDNAILKCIEAATGTMRWRARGFGHGSLFFADGHFIILGEHGTLAVVEANPLVYTEVARTRILETKTWTVPTLAHGRLFVRDERELVALDFTTRASTTAPPEQNGQ